MAARGLLAMREGASGPPACAGMGEAVVLRQSGRRVCVASRSLPWMGSPRVGVVVGCVFLEGRGGVERVALPVASSSLAILPMCVDLRNLHRARITAVDPDGVR